MHVGLRTGEAQNSTIELYTEVSLRVNIRAIWVLVSVISVVSVVERSPFCSELRVTLLKKLAIMAKIFHRNMAEYLLFLFKLCASCALQ
jgi:hypothetical protein